jgi:Tol biopolymer transport system component
VIVFASLCAVAIAVAAAALHSTRGPAESERLVVRATLALPKGLALPREDRNIAVSPDGTQVVVSLNTKNGSSPASLHLRDLSRLEFRQLPGTEGATYPFWSPDGKSIAFFAGTDLKRIDLADGIVRVICPAPAGRGGAWSTQGSIVFAPSAAGGLSIVDQAGGVASPVTQPASASESQRVPAMLPDGRRFLYYAMDAAKPGVYAFDPASKTSRFVVASDAEAVFVEPSSLVFARDENLVVQPFDLTRLELTGSPRPIAAGVNWDANRAALGVSLSSRGTLVYQTVVRAGTYKLAWMDRKGERTPIPVEPIAFAGGSLSSDGRRAAMNLAGDRGESFLAALDLDRGITTRIGEPNAKRYFGALLSRDGQRVITVDANQSGQAIVSFPFGGGAPTQLLEAEPGYEKSPTSITPDGRTLLLARVPLSDKLGDIMTLDLEGHEPPKPLIATPESEGSPLISPSGDIVAYLALNEASVLKLVRYPTPSTPVQVSPTAVSTYGWLSASELYWGDPSSKMWSASVSTKNGQLDVGAPRVMFNGAPLDKDVGIIAYDIARERFLIAIEASAPEEPQLILVSDWRQEAGAAQPARK